MCFFSFTGQTLGPKELKRQKDRERYAPKKDESPLLIKEQT
jgi:hypothetical protein